MKIPRAIRHASGAFAAAVFLAGCSGASQSLPGVSGPNQQNAFGSWASPKAAKASKLLYVSDNGTNEVYFYSYPKDVLMGTLTGFSDPQGLCVDKAGDVFVANHGAADIIEYAHGGTSPIATLNDPGEEPMGCSVDPTTGNLAVTSAQSLPSRGAGNVAIYPGATGTPTFYSDPNIYNYLYCAYDTKGNLYVDGKTYPSGYDAFGELPSGSSSFNPITLNATINYAIAIQWDHGALVVGNTYENNQIYRFKIKRGNGTEIGSPAALTHGYGVEQFTIDGKVIIGPVPAYPYVAFWNYPAGGLPLKDIGFPGGSAPVGTAISKL
jgi:hypothetical protein